MKKRIAYFIAGFIALSSGCSEDFLDKKPIAMDTEETFYSNAEALDQTLTAAYSILVAREIFDIRYIVALSSAEDDVETGGENTNDWPEFQRIDRYINSAEDAAPYPELWAYMYKGIRICNEMLTNYEKLIAAKPALNTPELQSKAAEARVLRAFYHWTLAKIFGGVPIVDHLLDPKEATSIKRNSIAEVYHFIENELEESIPLLKERDQIEPGRVSKGMAQALLAKVYLFESSYARFYKNDIDVNKKRFEGCEEHYDLALKYAENVINSGKYELVGINGERFDSWRNPISNGGIGGFRWIFTADGDNSKESVFECQNVQDGKGWSLSRGTYLVIYSTVRYAIDKNGKEQQLGWSFILPTKYMLDAFANKDPRETNLSPENREVIDPTLDPRFKTTVGQPGDTVNGAINNKSEWLTMSFRNLPTNTIGRKYECSAEEYWIPMGGRQQEGPLNIKIIRYADVVLTAAEAALMTGDKTKALNYVNMVRKRARMSGDTGYPKDLSDVTLEDIMHERRLEFACEGHRFFDLVRWNKAYDFINGIDLASGYNGVEFVKGKHEFFPIPAAEIRKSGGNLEQNPGW